MKINYDGIKANTATIGGMSTGQLFIGGNGKLLMKSDEYRGGNADSIVCMCLETGILITASPGARRRLVNGELTVDCAEPE